MLLTSDGSTTLLLEALVGEELVVHVSSQEQRPAGEFSEASMVFHDLTDRCPLLVRRSQVHMRQGEPISDNLVRAPVDGSALYALMEDRQAPLGRGMGRLGVSQARQLLSMGLGSWPDTPGSTKTCASKTYVMVERGRPVMYMAEKFNPAYVPVRTQDQVPASA
ncbi:MULTISPECIES: chorismate pyruvate-lyase family protein [Streptomyces]|uniref:chorismate pyruvate-lyase family protein n=1 Tax=Streptomyces TaxID=1883 RepID=UPI0023DD48B0|nr:chorismate pyruvate-lyase family protein [Streptomyces sp. FXJ1.172]WEP00632.1 chorismate pyruvate-lyase family protein [Streptomyces sp. FXJ1.172]